MDKCTSQPLTLSLSPQAGRGDRCAVVVEEHALSRKEEERWASQISQYPSHVLITPQSVRFSLAPLGRGQGEGRIPGA